MNDDLATSYSNLTRNSGSVTTHTSIGTTTDGPLTYGEGFLVKPSLCCTEPITL